MFHRVNVLSDLDLALDFDVCKWLQISLLCEKALVYQQTLNISSWVTETDA